MALLHEKRGFHEAALELHKAILAEHPTYVKCYLRLGCIARNCGQIREASEWFSQALEVEPDNPDVLSYFGNLHMRHAEWSPAQKKFEQILQVPATLGDSYAMLSLGNIYFANLEDKGKYERHLQHAANFYNQILVRDMSNAYAANGLGMVLAEKSNLDQAKDVFSQVREAASDAESRLGGNSLGDVWVNLAHVYLALGKHSEAIRLYQNCLVSVHGGRDPTLHMYLAHAYFEAKRFADCMRALLKASHLEPQNLTIWYNLALTRETLAVAVLKKHQEKEQRTVQEVRDAIKDLKGAIKLFKWLAAAASPRGKADKRKLPFQADKPNKHITYCETNLTKAASHLEHELNKQKERDGDRQKRQAKIDEQQRKREAEKLAEIRKQEETRAEAQERARSKEASLMELRGRWDAEAASSQPRAKTGKAGGAAQPRAEDINATFGDADDSSSEDEGKSDEERERQAVGAPDRYGGEAASSTIRNLGLDGSSDDSDSDDDDASVADGANNNGGAGEGEGTAAKSGDGDGDDEDEARQQQQQEQQQEQEEQELKEQAQEPSSPGSSGSNKRKHEGSAGDGDAGGGGPSPSVRGEGDEPEAKKANTSAGGDSSNED